MRGCSCVSYTDARYVICTPYSVCTQSSRVIAAEHSKGSNLLLVPSQHWSSNNVGTTSEDVDCAKRHSLTLPTPQSISCTALLI